jgi:hypothetical protein
MTANAPFNPNPAGSPAPHTRAGVGVHMLAFLGGCISGVAFNQLFQGGWLGIMLAYLNPLLLYVAALAGGRQAAITATAFGCIAVLLQMGAEATALYALLFAVPAMVIARASHIKLAGEWLNAGGVLLVALSIGVLLLVLTAIWLSMGDGVAKALDTVASTYKVVLMQMNSNITDEQATEAMGMFTAMLPSFIVVSWFVVHILNIGMAHWILASANKALRPSYDLSNLALPNYVSIIFLLAVAGAFVLDSGAAVILNAMASLLGLALMAIGLIILHQMIEFWCRRRQWDGTRRAVVFALYYVVMMIVQIPLVLAAAVGLADPWSQFRKKLNLSTVQ